MSESPRGPADSSVHQIEFTIRDTAQPFVGASKSTGCRFELAEMVPRSDGNYAEFFNVTGVEPGLILDLVRSHETIEVTLLRECDDGGLFEFLVAGDCPALTLAELGALPREVVGESGTGRIVAEVPPKCDPAVVIEEFFAAYPDAELTSKRTLEAVEPLFSESAFEQLLETELTARQREVLEAAFDAGYYEWPRESTGSKIAEELGISSATFSEHIHAAEHNLLSVLFDRHQTD